MYKMIVPKPDPYIKHVVSTIPITFLTMWHVDQLPAPPKKKDHSPGCSRDAAAPFRLPGRAHVIKTNTDPRVHS